MLNIFGCFQIAAFRSRRRIGQRAGNPEPSYRGPRRLLQVQILLLSHFSAVAIFWL